MLSALPDVLRAGSVLCNRGTCVPTILRVRRVDSVALFQGRPQHSKRVGTSSRIPSTHPVIRRQDRRMPIPVPIRNSKAGPRRLHASGPFFGAILCAAHGTSVHNRAGSVSAKKAGRRVATDRLTGREEKGRRQLPGEGAYPGFRPLINYDECLYFICEQVNKRSPSFTFI
jgi:hypothetical protein